MQISVNLVNEGNNIKTTVSDNGKGFDPENLEKTEGLGLKLIKERVDMLGGYVNVESSTGSGCKVTFQVPCLNPKD